MSQSKFTKWRKSLRSDAGNCVEVAFATDGTVGVRDSKNRIGSVLEFGPGEWDALIAGAKAGESARIPFSSIKQPLGRRQRSMADHLTTLPFTAEVKA